MLLLCAERYNSTLEDFQTGVGSYRVWVWEACRGVCFRCGVCGIVGCVCGYGQGVGVCVDVCGGVGGGWDNVGFVYGYGWMCEGV